MMWQYLVLIIYTLTLSLILIFSIGQSFLIFSYLKKKPKNVVLEKLNPTKLPIVTVQLPLYNEIYVVEQLINSVCELNYPKEKLEIQVLDDSDDECYALVQKIIKQKQAQGFDIHHINRKINIGFKAGALQHGLKFAKGEFIAIFDADFIPEIEFLNQLLPYFKQNIGMVQSKWGHTNANYSLLTKVQAFALDGHFTIEQTGRNNANLLINFNGTAGMWRKSCIIDAGGWQHDTLTEDLDLSYRAQLKGWKFDYVENVITPAQLPVDLNAFRSQQHRWTKGAIETSKKMLYPIWKNKNQTFSTKIFATLHLCYSYNFLLAFISIVLSLPLLYIKNQHLVNPLYFQVISVFWLGFLALFLFYFVSYFSYQKGIKNFVALFIAFISITMAMSFHNSLAVVEGIFGKKSSFIRTPKFISNSIKNNKYINHRIPFTFYIEFILGIYFSLAIYLGFYYHDFCLILFHIMLCFGFFTLVFYSLKIKFTN